MGKLGLSHLYSAKKGRTQILKPRLSLEKPITTKWRNILPPSYRPRWKEVWLPRRPKKEAGFIWSVYHCAIAVNAWRQQMDNQIIVTCACCTTGQPETVLHRMVECPRALIWWKYALTILYRYCDTPQTNGAWPNLVWQQCLFGSKLPRRLAKGKTHLVSSSRFHLMANLVRPQCYSFLKRITITGHNRRSNA